MIKTIHSNCKICGIQIESGPFCEECAKKYAAKADAGKPIMSLAPISELWKAVARIREYGNKKYHNQDNWKNVDVSRYWDAFLRHTAECVKHGIKAKDEESGYLHLWHMACNLCFILELMGREEDKS